jgi:hypothetical protein
MKSVAIALGLIASFAIGFSIGRRAPQSDSIARPNLAYVLEQLRHLRAADRNIQYLSLAEFGMGSRPAPSYLLFKYVAAVATPPELVAMLEDKSAVVRVVGAMVILKERGKDMRPASVDALLSDQETIMVFDSSCIPRDMSVGAVVAGLLKDPTFMDVQKEKPTQSEAMR